MATGSESNFKCSISRKMKKLIHLLFLVATAYSIKEIPIPDYGQTDDTILQWEAPEETKRDYPYYLSGYDEDGAAIWVAELGKWDTRKATEGTPEGLRNYKRNVIQMLKRISGKEINQEKRTLVNEFYFIIDMEKFDSRQSSTRESLNLMLWVARQADQAFTDKLRAAYIVNANYVFNKVFELMKPLLGRALHKVEVHGTNRNIWIPKLMKHFPKEQVPAWYGGSKEHKPLKVYG
ncbi:unnamed protein product [Allacma fusca]|uniref:CRAL-TRIO domain-containing protein n=1 Tax=Allacma fusca TaxID=39272 RepID=A0A8J2JGY4_9HEXA|nr:unnamed protein product [Allacma fusca]